MKISTAIVSIIASQVPLVLSSQQGKRLRNSAHVSSEGNSDAKQDGTSSEPASSESGWVVDWSQGGKCVDGAGKPDWMKRFPTEEACCASPEAGCPVSGYYMDWGLGGKCVFGEDKPSWMVVYESQEACCAAEKPDDIEGCMAPAISISALV
jgi:hypothetical protein